jgi:NAD+ synthase (glutamine-hydrolysing)
MNTLFRLGIAQINPTVGDLENNFQKILAYMKEARGHGVDLLCFPELALTGYPPEDLLLKPQFIRNNHHFLDRLVEASADFAPTVLGFVDSDSTNIFNAAALFGHASWTAIQQIFLTLPPYSDMVVYTGYFTSKSCRIMEFSMKSDILPKARTIKFLL